MYNGVPVKLTGCGGHTHCEYKAFEKHMDDLLYTGDLEAACAPAYNPSDVIPKVAVPSDNTPTSSATSFFDITNFSSNIFELLQAAFKYHIENIMKYIM